MLHPFVDTKVPTYRARAFARRPVVPTLRKPDAKALLASVPNAKPHYVWPCYPIHPECPEVDCKHWDEPERWEDEQMPAPVIGDTEWNAWPVTLGEHGRMERCAWSSSGHVVHVMLPPIDPRAYRYATSATIDVTPLVKAAERKEAELLLKVAPQNDCLYVEAPAIPAPAPNGHQPAPCPETVLSPVILIDGKPETAERQAARRASCTLRKAGEKRTTFYFGKEGAVAQ